MRINVLNARTIILDLGSDVEFREIIIRPSLISPTSYLKRRGVYWADYS